MKWQANTFLGAGLDVRWLSENMLQQLKKEITRNCSESSREQTKDFYLYAWYAGEVSAVKFCVPSSGLRKYSSTGKKHRGWCFSGGEKERDGESL